MGAATGAGEKEEGRGVEGRGERDQARERVRVERQEEMVVGVGVEEMVEGRSRAELAVRDRAVVRVAKARWETLAVAAVGCTLYQPAYQSCQRQSRIESVQYRTCLG